MRNEIAIAIIAILLAVLCYGWGYANGAKDLANWGVNAALALVDADKLNIEVDEAMLKRAILQYQNNIGGCLFMQNASLHDDTGNS